MLELNLAWLASIVFIPLLLISFSLIGIATILHLQLFSLAVIGYAFCAYLIIRIIQKRNAIKNVLTPNDTQASLLNVAIVGVGSIFNWFAHLISKHETTYSQIFRSVEISGFPFTSFYFPQSRVGGDIPPRMWLPFFLNQFLWTVASYYLIQYLDRTSRIKYKHVYSVLIIISIIITLAGLGYTTLKFDD